MTGKLMTDAELATMREQADYQADCRTEYQEGFGPYKVLGLIDHIAALQEQLILGYTRHNAFSDEVYRISMRLDDAVKGRPPIAAIAKAKG